MSHYKVKAAKHLLDSDIKAILHFWEMHTLTPDAFREKFKNSEFHLVKDYSSTIRAVARVNFDFKLRINEQLFAYPEFGGFVALPQGKGYGTELLQYLIQNLKKRKLEALGFCEKPLRPYYEKCGIRILYDQAKFLRTAEQNEWIPSSDDDILDLTLSPASWQQLQSLSPANLAYLVED
ncbi:hypothetical protein AHMF7605_24675 [Adhaeribacter arboris]|uniref:N-acetyltransferase domain-containing protein n=1 Tax=Adhaeribacter arboris TaxID=2072846 RepID=A0A2T2YLS1_9BACT|nr:GNAT family N-acetyltransferase [Adhaeribacter arboris]PSR56462.1 hypothetical protein AHMF7605_24675 [Adhaeribacter arboris]